MHAKAPIIGVVGPRNSGKTSVIESIVRELTKRGYRVATAKHVNQKGFSMDTKGKDTWRHSAAGANPVVSVSDVETAILIKDGALKSSLDRLLSFTPEADIIVLEGFSWLVLDDEHVGKILCVRNREEYEGLREKARGEIIAFCSAQPMGKPILGIKEDSKTLVRRTLRYIRRKRKISKILSRLPGLNCEKCGHPSCEEMAATIYRRRAKLSDCITLKLRSKLKTRITVNDAEIPIQPFASEIIRNSLLGMVSTLKGVSISGNEEVQIRILS
jgi:molybdopterin-guanine dinucleotide biosynthesis protein MobB